MSETTPEGGTQTGGTGSGDQGQQNGQQGGQGAQTGGAGSGGQGQPGAQGQQGGASAGGAGAEDITALPKWAQDRFNALQREAGSARVNAKAQAAAEAEAAVIKRLGKALGLIKDENLTPEQLQEELAKTSSAHRSAQVELAVLKVAPKAKGNPTALLDSRSFLDKIGKLDPTSDEFTSQVEAAIAQAVRDNPLLGVGTPAGSSGGAIPGGTGDAGGDESEETILKRIRATRGVR